MRWVFIVGLLGLLVVGFLVDGRSHSAAEEALFVIFVTIVGASLLAVCVAGDRLARGEGARRTGERDAASGGSAGSRQASSGGAAAATTGEAAAPAAGRR